MKRIYLDYAAATPLDKTVLAAMRPYFADMFYNPSALYLASKSVAAVIATARKNVANWLGARPSEIIFTAGGTEANNLALHGVMRHYPEANMVVSTIEHDSVMKPAQTYPCQQVAVDDQGMVDIEDLKRKINDKTVLVSIMYANNEIGVIEPLTYISRLLKDIRDERRQAGNILPLYFHSDACQASNYLSLQVNRLGVDLMTLNGGKIYGPKQSGALYVAAHTVLTPLVLGGGQERGMRSGTENVPSIVGFAAALDLVQSCRHQESKRLAELQAFFLHEMGMHLPQAKLNGSKHSRLVNNVNIILPGQDNERLVMALDEQGVQCAAGSACSALQDEPSHVLRAIGLDEAAARSSLRFTFGRETDRTAIHKTIALLAKVVA